MITRSYKVVGLNRKEVKADLDLFNFVHDLYFGFGYVRYEVACSFKMLCIR